MNAKKNEPKMTRSQFEALLKKEAEEKQAKRQARADRKARKLNKAKRQARKDRKARKIKRVERKIRKIRRDLREAKLKVKNLKGITAENKPIKTKSKATKNAEAKKPEVEVKIVAKARSTKPAMALRTGLVDKAGDEICVGDTVSIKAKKAQTKGKKSK